MLIGIYSQRKELKNRNCNWWGGLKNRSWFRDDRYGSF